MATPGNPLGATILFDGENPRTFTATAREAISGGEFVFVSGATGVVGSGTSTFADGDIQVALSADATRLNGLALQNAGSNANLAVITRGSTLVRCGGSVLGGTLVETIGDSVAVQSLSSGLVPTGFHTGIIAGKIVGRAQTDGASGGFAIVDLHF